MPNTKHVEIKLDHINMLWSIQREVSSNDSLR